jgi:hypothetical protein
MNTLVYAIVSYNLLNVLVQTAIKMGLQREEKRKRENGKRLQYLEYYELDTNTDSRVTDNFKDLDTKYKC